MSSTTQPRSSVIMSSFIGSPHLSTRYGPRCTCAALALMSLVNSVVFATSSSMDFASSSLVTVGSSLLPSRPYESVFRTSEPEKLPCSLVTTTREQPAKAFSSNLTCGAGEFNYATYGVQIVYGVQCGARKARLRWLESEPAMELDYRPVRSRLIRSPIHNHLLRRSLLRRSLLGHRLLRLSITAAELAVPPRSTWHGIECLAILRGNWVASKAASAEECRVMGRWTGSKA
eukprot:scaffold4936_cov73-Phaeocystis_antarctica.AAC.6